MNEDDGSSSSSEESQVRVMYIPCERVNELAPVWQRLEKETSPYLVGLMLTPNFNASLLNATPGLQNAFDTSAPFRNRAIGTGRGPYLSAADQKLLMPRGYAIKLDGSMPIDSEARVYHTLGGWNAGLGTSMYAVKSLPDKFQGASDERVMAECTESARDDQPHLISPSHRISLARTADPFKGTSYVLFVTANDVPAARRLVQYTATRAASNEPLNVETLLTSTEYSDLLDRSQLTRDRMARQFAKAHGLELEPEAIHTSLTHSASQANNLAHGAHGSLPIHVSRESRYYVIYNDAIDASQAHDGQVLVSHGMMGGFTMLKNAAAEQEGVAGSVKVNKSLSWNQPNALSAMPSNSVEVHEKETRARAMHVNQSDRTRQAFESRVTWHSDIGTKFTHSASREAFNAMNDPFTTKWLDKLAPSHVYDTLPLTQQQYTFVIGQLPNISTLYTSESELARLARHESTPKNIPLALDHPIVARVPALYDQVIRSAGYPTTLDSIFKNVYEQESPEGSFGRLYEASALDSPPVDSSLYSDSERFGLSQSTGVPLSAAARFGDTAAARMMSPDDIDALRAQITNRAQRTQRHTRTVINMDKKLLELITTKAQK